jgi:hypothetical protein
LAFGEETFKRALKAKLVEVLREELTSGDGNVKALLAQLLLSVVLRDSAGVELSGYLKNLDTALSSRASESTLLAIKAKTDDLDVMLSTLSRLMRWGRDVSPVWVHGGEIATPATNTTLVSWTVPEGKVGYIYGFFISAGEGNDFRINWTSGGVTRSRRIVFPGRGTLQYVDVVAFNEGLPADPGTSVTITNVNAGSAGVVYQVALLVAVA